MSIKLLNKNVINQISAGEVVEKPASVVKELVENSIDAGATSIEIEIKKGGIEYISVKDNGCGINSDEVKLAFTPHATSKLENISDFDTLNTMGFRGEALATISAVSKVTMVTKTANEDVGVFVNLVGGEQIEQREIACVTGTKIEVCDVFFNTPARLKFLRKPKSEENDITNYVEKLILSHSDISFKYVVDNKVIYNTISSMLIDNIYAIYGKELSSNLLKVEYNIDLYRVYGYISKPEFAKSNRTYQNLFVNSRFCNNALVSAAVSNAYENFTMKGKFPVYILFLEMPQKELDVNVHPNKLEVKFANTQIIYKVFNDAVFKALSDYNHIRQVDTQIDNELIVNKTEQTELKTVEKNEGVSYNQDDEEYNKLLNECKESFKDYNNKSGTFDFRLTNKILPEVDIISEPEDELDSKEQNKISETITQEVSNSTNVQQEDFKQVLNMEYNLIGVAFNTYLILEYNDKLFLIDQHAAHERQNYDKIMHQLNTNSLQIQNLLIPYIFKVSPNEANFLNDNLNNLISFGIDICEFGYNTYKISSVPLVISDINLEKFFEEIFDNLSSIVKSPQEVIKDKFMQMACKSAVKGGDKLNKFEIEYLLNQIKDDTEVLLCPHGRPIVVEITKKQVEKWFKRIV